MHRRSRRRGRRRRRRRRRRSRGRLWRRRWLGADVEPAHAAFVRASPALRLRGRGCLHGRFGGDPRRFRRRGTRVPLRVDPRQVLHAAGAGGEDHRQGERDRPTRRSRLVRDRHLEDAAHAIDQRSAGRRQRHVGRHRAPGFELGERLRVADRVTADRDRDVVAAVLALHPNPVRHPPHCRMVEQQRLGDRLQHVHRVVVAADVRELVREDRLDLRRRQRRERGDGQQDRRPQPADNRRHVHERGFDDVRGRGQAETIREPAAGGLPMRRGRREREAVQTPHLPPSAGHAREQQDHAGEPRDGDGGKDVFERCGVHQPRTVALRHTGTVRAGALHRSNATAISGKGARGSRSGRHGCAVGPGRGTDRRRARRGPHHARGQGRRGKHRGQTRARDGVAGARRSAPREPQQRRRNGRDGGALPHEMDQRPTGHLEIGSHRDPPGLMSSIAAGAPAPRSSFLISASSSGDDLLAASACRTSLAADPSNARSSRSVTS